MTQEEKYLLLKYLCMALPYMIIIKSVGENKIIGLWDLRDIDNLPLPYLRPMSSMTEEEKRELSKRYVWHISNGMIKIRYHSDGYWDSDTECSTEEYLWVFTWLLEHHFDFMGLIPKGLAIEVTKDVNPYE